MSGYHDPSSSVPDPDEDPKGPAPGVQENYYLSQLVSLEFVTDIEAVIEAVRSSQLLGAQSEGVISDLHAIKSQALQAVVDIPSICLALSRVSDSLGTAHEAALFQEDDSVLVFEWLAEVRESFRIDAFAFEFDPAVSQEAVDGFLQALAQRLEDALPDAPFRRQVDPFADL